MSWPEAKGLWLCPDPEPEGGGEEICLVLQGSSRYAIFLVRAELEKGWDLVPRTIAGSKLLTS